MPTDPRPADRQYGGHFSFRDAATPDPTTGGPRTRLSALDANDIEWLVKRHYQREGYCHWDDAEWPCVTRRLLDLVEGRVETLAGVRRAVERLLWLHDEGAKVMEGGHLSAKGKRDNPTHFLTGRTTRVLRGHQLDQWQRIHKMPPGPDRWRERSRTYAGIAAAMADQWGRDDWPVQRTLFEATA